MREAELAAIVCSVIAPPATEEDALTVRSVLVQENAVPVAEVAIPTGEQASTFEKWIAQDVTVPAIAVPATVGDTPNAGPVSPQEIAASAVVPASANTVTAQENNNHVKNPVGSSPTGFFYGIRCHTRYFICIFQKPKHCLLIVCNQGELSL